MNLLVLITQNSIKNTQRTDHPVMAKRFPIVSPHTMTATMQLTASRCIDSKNIRSTCHNPNSYYNVLEDECKPTLSFSCPAQGSES